MTESWDAVVIGGGPCGAVAARSLARRAWRVALVDRQAFPRDKVCGDTLLPDALNILRTLGLADEVASVGHPVRRISVFSPNGREVNATGEFLTLRRAVLDAVLHRAAAEAGAQTIEAAAVSLSETADTVRVEFGARPPLAARACVLATGANTRLLRLLRPATVGRPTAVASRRYVRSRHSIDRLIVTYDRGLGPAYAWIFPLGDCLYNVGVGSLYRPRTRFDHRALFERFTAVFPEAHALMAAHESVSRLRSAPLRCGLDEGALRPGRFCLAAGELAAATLPLTGEGIGTALETGLLAADAVHAFLAGDPAGLDCYAPAVRRLRPRYRAYAWAHRLLDHPRLVDLATWRLSRSPRLTARLVAILRAEADPRSLFSARALLTWLLR